MQRVTRTGAARLPADFDALVRRLPPSAIVDEVGYRNAQEMIDALSCVPNLTPDQSRYLKTLTILFKAYEDEHHDIDTSAVGTVEVLKALMEERGMSQSDLGRLLGERSLGSKVIGGQRALSKAHIRKLAKEFAVDPSLFL